MGVAERLPEPFPPPSPSPTSRPSVRVAPAGERALRRAVDVVGAGVLIVITLPLLLAGMAAVLLCSGPPVFYGHARVGKGGRTFRCWKLRTMELRAEERLRVDASLARRYRENGYKLPADPRATAPGRILRRLYLDELPQLFNVLFGTMSLVGPRPVVADELTEYEDGVETLLSIRPGIFGEWNSLGRRRPAYPERARVELEYVRRRTLARDLRILFRSLPVVLRGFPDDV